MLMRITCGEDAVLGRSVRDLEEALDFLEDVGPHLVASRLTEMAVAMREDRWEEAIRRIDSIMAGFLSLRQGAVRMSGGDN